MLNDDDRRALYELKGGFEFFMQNHWPHLLREVEEIRSRLWWVLGTVLLGTAVGVAGLFLQ